MPVLFALILTDLVSYGAGGLACALTGSLALAAATLFQCVLKGSGIESLDMLHNNILHFSQKTASYHITNFVS